jgi:adenosylcobinamide kinase/adenosylcobinamide-phosphate guanylyltransferase
MKTLISGGAGSGKSALAEALALRSPATQRVYLATMEVWGEEDRQRVERHRRQRHCKGFLTVERSSRLTELTLPEDCGVLLEDLGNLCANECFGPLGFQGAEERILAGVAHIQEQAKELVVVTNELFSDGICYPPETEHYLSILGSVNCTLARRAERVIETVAGLPIVWKGVLE